MHWQDSWNFLMLLALWLIHVQGLTQILIFSFFFFLLFEFPVAVRFFLVFQCSQAATAVLITMGST